MRGQQLLLAAALICASCAPASALEGPTAAGPIGGYDIRSAQLPPPGTYVGAIFLAAEAFDFVDGKGKTIGAFREANLKKYLAGPFLFYVPDMKVLGGSMGVGVITPMGTQCGHLFVGEAENCTDGFGDPYVEIDWSRSFGELRPSKFEGAYPIQGGLTVLAGFGVVFPAGTFTSSHPTRQALSIGTNTWDFAPTFGVTYTTQPIFADGTELSVRLLWNNYLENAATRYSTGDLLDIEFALTERIGRLQMGVAGFYAWQPEDDELLGLAVPPDGRRAEIFQIGPVINLDIPEYTSSVKVKALFTGPIENNVRSWGVALSWITKL